MGFAVQFHYLGPKNCKISIHWAIGCVSSWITKDGSGPRLNCEAPQAQAYLSRHGMAFTSVPFNEPNSQSIKGNPARGVLALLWNHGRRGGFSAEKHKTVDDAIYMSGRRTLRRSRVKA